MIDGVRNVEKSEKSLGKLIGAMIQNVPLMDTSSSVSLKHYLDVVKK